MPIADLPYRIESLAKNGQYAYLSRPVVRVKATAEDKPVKPKSGTRLRVLRNVNLCDGPTLWDAIRDKNHSTEEVYGFYVTLRLFGTRSMVQDYLSGPELASYCQAVKVAIPVLHEGDMVITEDIYMSDQVVALTKSEYSRMLHSRDGDMSLESLEELVCQMQGVDSLQNLGETKRGRKKKAVQIIENAASIAAETPKPIVVVAPESGDEEDAACTATSASDRPLPTAVPKKKKPKSTLREQFVLVQNTPSRVIDVSGYGDTMQHQRGKILDRVRHGERIAVCTSLEDLFPIISDNVPAFERAMNMLGSRYSQRITEFKTLHAARSARKA